MSVTEVTALAMTLSTASADIADADATDVSTAADGWDIAAAWSSNVATPLPDGARVLIKFVDDGSGATVTVSAGDNPPAIRKGLGDLSITLAASDVKYVCVESARFMQSTGVIHALSSDEGTKCGAFVLPKGG